ncbi:bifunctional protein-serine/threonine kinase/phosphatase [Alkalimarinus sediminis]|uniref:Protein kinase n=2 Tax=Alkalimarinus sediminis TaxID=1632866 RepID=A0A9E8KIB6_9ALTE|nr:bifunctional protein-serine/threonine kinase/phosphatase [Alkalimarinus sediminis]UZW73776.1 protein kinase [Alkalimarinus sediminis]
MHLSSRLNTTIGQATDKGPKHQNEDCMGIMVPDEPALTIKGMVAVIADGVSSAEAGKEASETCVKNFLNDYYSTPDSWTVKTSSQKVLTALNRWLYGQGQRFIDAHRGYISTLSILVIKSRMAHIFHIGDSRIYRLRGGEFEQLTSDHSAHVSKDKAYLTRAMGMDIRLDVDYRIESVEAGDLFFLSTDGIHDFLSKKEIKKALQSASSSLNVNTNSNVNTSSNVNTNFEDVCQALIDQAKEVGSDDNLSCQIVRVDQLPDANSEDVYKKLSDLPFPPFLEVGMSIDGYRVLQEIHASNRSQLYVVEDIASHKKWVMKTPSVNFEDDPAYIERFIMEEWIGRRIDCPNVVKVPEEARKRQCLYYLCEYVEGNTLAKWIETTNKRDVGQILDIVEQVVRGVRSLHRKETLHQDIKPDNIVITPDGEAKLIDFGSCLVAGVNEIATPFERDTILGTATYAAPEYKLRRAGSVRSDLFSIAMMTYEMLTGHLPFGEAFDHCESAQDFSRLKYQPAYLYNPMVPAWMDGALKKALHFSPELRYESLSEFVFDLKHPNQQFMRLNNQPMLERNPLLFWKVASGILLVGQMVTLYLWLS